MAAAKDKSIPDAPQGGTPVKGDPDPKDEASRSAKGENDAKASDKSDPPAGAEPEHADDASDDDDMPDESDVPTDDASDDTHEPSDEDSSDDDDEDPDDDDDEDEEPDDGSDASDDDDKDKKVEEDDCASSRDAYDDSYNEDGDLTAKARHKLASSSFAVPDREGLPIHDPDHTKAAMGRFNQYEFKDNDEKHAAYNRILRRASHFGIDPSGFQKANEDHLDSKDDMKKLAALQKKLDAITAERDTLQGRLDGKDAKQPRNDAEEIAKRVDAKAALVSDAKSFGAAVDAKMSDKAIKIAVIKHLDGVDVPETKSSDYVDARYDAATEDARKDAAKTEAGAQALGAAREAAVAPRADAEQRMDLAQAEEAARLRSQSAYRDVPVQYQREFIMAKGGSPVALTQLALKNYSSEN